MTKARTSASGEKNGISDYFIQYEFSASTIYRMVQKNRLDRISICNPSVGIFDDLVVFSKTEVIGH